MFGAFGGVVFLLRRLGDFLRKLRDQLGGLKAALWIWDPRALGPRAWSFGFRASGLEFRGLGLNCLGPFREAHAEHNAGGCEVGFQGCCECQFLGHPDSADGHSV